MQKTLYYISIALAVLGGISIGLCLGLLWRGGFNLAYFFIALGLLFLALLLAFLSTVINFNPQGAQNRTRQSITTSYEEEDVLRKIEDILFEDKFHASTYGQEKVYQHGKGLFSTRKYLKVMVKGKKIVLEGFISLGFKNKVNQEYALDNSSFAKNQKNILLLTMQKIENAVKG